MGRQLQLDIKLCMQKVHFVTYVYGKMGEGKGKRKEKRKIKTKEHLPGYLASQMV
jgi:hypothetical protein